MSMVAGGAVHTLLQLSSPEQRRHVQEEQPLGCSVSALWQRLDHRAGRLQLMAQALLGCAARV